MKKKETSIQPRETQSEEPVSFHDPLKSFRNQQEETFPVVGIGASAGGLEALEQFLRNVPEDCRIALVIVQHLDPTHPGIMPELLQRITKLKVLQVRDRMKVRPGFVYVIPPNRNMSLLKGTLHLFEPVIPRGLRLPIDFFFRSLAEDLQERSIGIILSGMGSDGTLGLRAIKEKAGITLVQDPATAKFDGMPGSAVEAGLADVIGSADSLPSKLLEYIKHPVPAVTKLPLETKVQSALDKVIILLRSQTGHDFSMYKKSTIYRRIERRMMVHQIEKISQYVNYLQENTKEGEILFRELLIGVTSFFRDPLVWEKLIQSFLPGLFARIKDGRQLRAWVPACSTGEEAYSMAIAFREAQDRLQAPKRLSLQIFATDLDFDAIEKARKGFFPFNIAADIEPEILKKYFIEEEKSFRVRPEIRDMIIFATQSVIADPPFTRLDMLSCRNFLIYLETEMQQKLLPLFHYSLNPEGLLILGSAETTGNLSELFQPLDIKSRIYSRLSLPYSSAPVAFPSVYFPGKKNVPAKTISMKTDESFQTTVDQFLLHNFSPASVLITEKGDIVYISGHTGSYLEPAAGKANWNIFAMARDGLRNLLPKAIYEAVHDRSTLILKNVKISSNGNSVTADVSVQYVSKPEALQGMVLIVFREIKVIERASISEKKGKKPKVNERIGSLQEELLRSREELATTREEMQTSQEELKSINEELQSTNEELQSTNEELTTSKEEMQSLNEELQTVNAELQSKVDELSKTSDDMKNLLDSTDIATVFLDRNLHIRRYTQSATRLIKLIPGDIGRPLTDITTNLLYIDLAKDAEEVLRTLIYREIPVQTTDSLWYNVKIMPYRTVKDQIDGLVLTFSDITKAKSLEEELHKTIKKLKSGNSSKA